MTDIDRAIDWIIKSDDAKKYDIRVEEKKLFGITIFKRITIFNNMMEEAGEMIKSDEEETSEKLRKLNGTSSEDKENHDN